MRGTDLRFFIFDLIRGQAQLRENIARLCRGGARRLVGGKGLIALGLAVVFIVLPVCLAHSYGSATAPIGSSDRGLTLPVSPFDRAGELVIYGRTEADQPTRSDPSSQTGPEASIQSFSTYPSPTPGGAPSTAWEKQQLVEEIQRRLARIKAGTMGTTEPEQSGRTSPRAQTASPSTASNLSMGLDADMPLQLFQPSRRPQPAVNLDEAIQTATMNAAAATPSAITEVTPRESVTPGVVMADPIQGRKVASAENRPADVPPVPSTLSNPEAQAAFNSHSETARSYQQQGQYLQAAEAFTLALAYRPNDAETYLAKAHALFAAGQYGASAVSLTRAAELNPQRSLRKVDLVGLTGGPDAFITRFNDMARYIMANPTPEQQFLLAYIYYQMDQLREAKITIDIARKNTSSPAAVESLAAAISH